MSLICPICKTNAEEIVKDSRSNSKVLLGNCRNCDFLFADIDNINSLKNNQLDETRLKKAGLKIPSIEKDFKNGSLQAKRYFNEYLNSYDFPLNILEIGCSWGYFLNILKNKNHNVIGIEISKERRNYVEKNLQIKCLQDINMLKNSSLRFDKIFLFYVIEYINDPKNYIEDLIKFLKKDGEIIIITPNKNDVLLNIWSNKSYEKFIIDEHVINYFSVKSLEKLSKLIDRSIFKIYNQQGYSLYNHLKWYFTNKPSTTGIVGGDIFTEDIKNQITNNKDIKLSNKIKTLITNTNKEYQKIIEENNMGNSIIVRIKRI
tara:strand:- start:265 stop:1215 length:951 start_codon:yes stop_codon:yes gene_type:complete